MSDTSPRGDLEFGTIPRLVREAATRHDGAEALVDVDSGYSASFTELAEQIDAAARSWIALGIEPGDRVAVWAPNIWEWVVAGLGVHAAGGVLVTVNTRFKGREAAYVLESSGARALVTVTDFLGTDYVEVLHGAVDVGSELPHLEHTVVVRGAAPDGAVDWQQFLAQGVDIDDAIAAERADSVSSDDVSDLLFTSGTTGSPKGVETTHGQNLRAFRSWGDVVGLAPRDRYLVVNPFFHAFGYKAGILAALMAGATILPHAVFDAGEVLERIPRDHISMLPGPATLYQTILATPDLATHDLSSLRLAVTGAAAIPVELIVQMREQLGFDTVITGYGLTEAAGIATMCRHDDDPETIATTSGRAIPGVEVLVVNDDGAEAPRGEPGEVVVRGYNVMRGYFNDPAATAEAIDADGWLHTGDIGVMDENGYLRITDRLKDMYVVGGFNAYPAEIEGLITAHPGVAQAAVIGVPDERMGEVGMAFVVPMPDSELDADELRRWCRDEMANYKVPRTVRIVDALPMNATGKVLKYELRTQA